VIDLERVATFIAVVKCGGFREAAKQTGLSQPTVTQHIKRLEQRMLGILAGRRQAARALIGAIDGLSPLAILARGYGIIQTVPEGAVVKHANEVSAGDQIQARLADGRLVCVVRQVIPEP